MQESVGVSDTCSFDFVVIPGTEKNYVDYCNVAKRAMGKNRLIFINSWNDFQKGNTLEPATEYTNQYLLLTKRELKKP